MARIDVLVGERQDTHKWVIDILLPLGTKLRWKDEYDSEQVANQARDELLPSICETPVEAEFQMKKLKRR